MGSLYKKFIILIVFMVTIINSNYSCSYGFDKEDVYEELQKTDNLSLEEFEVQGSFYFNAKEEKNKILKDIIINLEKEVGKVTLDKKEENYLSIDFKEKDYEGEVQIYPYKDKYNLILTISKKGENLNYTEAQILNNQLEKVLSSINSRVEYSLCLRSKILCNTIEEMKEEVLNNIILNNGENTEVIKINNGYSIISNLSRENKKLVLGKEIDFNCAIVKYSSGCYLIMGTPEITLTY